MSNKKIKKLCVGVQKYAEWIFVNFFLCLLPIIAIHLFNCCPRPQVFSSFLAYNYTLMIASLYLFLTHLRKSLKTESSSGLIIWLTIGVILILWAYFFLYNLPHEINRCVTENMEVISGIVLIVIFLFALLLNYPLLKASIAETVSRKLFEETNKIEKESEHWLAGLKEDEK